MATNLTLTYVLILISPLHILYLLVLNFSFYQSPDGANCFSVDGDQSPSGTDRVGVEELVAGVAESQSPAGADGDIIGGESTTRCVACSLVFGFAGVCDDSAADGVFSLGCGIFDDKY